MERSAMHPAAGVNGATAAMVVTAMTSGRNMNASLGRTAPITNAESAQKLLGSSNQICANAGRWEITGPQSYSSSSSEGGSICSERMLQANSTGRTAVEK